MSGPAGTVAVFTARSDVTADYVVSELNRRGVPVFRCDPGDYPDGVTITARSGRRWSGQIAADGRVLDLRDVACAWWRRPSPIQTHGGAESDWSSREARAGFRGVVALLPWLNHPDHLRWAEYKPVQLAEAARVGLAVPPTLLTNDPLAVRAFAREHPTLMYKPLTAGRLSDGRMVYASTVDLAEVDDSVRLTTHLFQPRMPKAHELRVTMVDGRPFVARIDAKSTAAQQDWRADYRSLTYSTDTLPPTVLAQVRAFMARMGLRFAAIDMIVTPTGDHVFLEANPNGQWAWIEDATGLPIAAAIADALQGHT